MDAWKDITGMVEYPRDGILSKVIFSSGEESVTLFCMSGGSAIEDHTSTKKGFAYVIEGRGAFVLEGKNIVMAPGKLIRIDRNTVHRLSAKENMSFMLFLSK